MALALIPARSGSKRIKGKNSRPFLGTPIIQRTIKTALESGCFDHIIVSTDSEDIAALAEGAGAIVPFMRSPALSDDHTTTMDVIQDALQQCEAQEFSDAHWCCLYPTAVFTRPADLQHCHQQLLTSGADYVVPVVAYSHPLDRALTLEKGRITMLDQNASARRTQDLATAYHDCGQFYFGRRDAFLAGLSVFAGSALGYVMPRWRAIDIDTEDDWDMAEKLYPLVGG